MESRVEVEISQEESTTVAEPNAVKLDALRRLKALESRKKTVGTHLDELRELLTVLFQMLPD